MKINRDPFVRKHDGIRVPPIVQNPRAHCTPENLQELIALLRDPSSVLRQLGDNSPDPLEIHAVGSHWALSNAAVTTGIIIETDKLNRTLYEIVPDRLNETTHSDLINQASSDPFIRDPNSYNLYHVEAGIKIYDLYSRLDGQNPDFPLPTSRGGSSTETNQILQGPWALHTMGGAGGQSIIGAISTGTHGGMLNLPPIADAVQAIHMIGADGKQYWIERWNEDEQSHPVVDDVTVQNLYGPGGLIVDGAPIEVVRDKNFFNSALVSVGRFGVIYSVILKVVRQYGLVLNRFSSTWSSVQNQLRNPNDPIYNHDFLQVAVNPHSSVSSQSEHLCSVTTYDYQQNGINNIEMMFNGRAMRAGQNAGKTRSIGPSNEFYSNICNVSNARELLKPVVDGLDNPSTPIGSFLHEIFSSMGPFGSAFRELLRDQLNDLSNFNGTLGDFVVEVCNFAIDNDIPWLVQILNQILMENLEKPTSPEFPNGIRDISYAILDGRNYDDQFCQTTADSIEIAFDGQSDDYIRFINQFQIRVKELLDGNMTLPDVPNPIGKKAYAGYVSLRITRASRALIAMQRWPRTAHLEIATLKGMSGTGFLFQKLQNDALEIGRMGRGTVVHWGQLNSLNSLQIEETCPGLEIWRNALSKVTQNGNSNSFSTAFTREKGLELKAQINADRVCLHDGKLRIDLTGIRFTPNSNVQIQSVPRDLIDVPPEVVSITRVDSTGRFQSSFIAFDPGPNAAILLNATDDRGISANTVYGGGCI